MGVRMMAPLASSRLMKALSEPSLVSNSSVKGSNIRYLQINGSELQGNLLAVTGKIMVENFGATFISYRRNNGS
jgi:hypothetical protein